MEAIQLIPGKKPESLLSIIVDGAEMCFHKSVEDKYAYVEVNSLFRTDPSMYYPDMSAMLCKLLKDTIDVEGTNVYIRYTSTPDWGYNGKNF